MLKKKTHIEHLEKSIYSQQLATDIIKKLIRAGHIAYFAGGWVRDYLLGHPSEDIDIATDAPPEKIINLFPNTLLIGLAFGIVIVLVDGHQFEVATFRRDIDYIDGRKPTSIELATPLEDASRRDFTINGMFYDPLKNEIYDYVHGQTDLKHRLIRTIGDPYERFQEDRLRMIRAIRFAARFGFTIDMDTQEAIKGAAFSLFPAVAMERIWNEFVKMSQYPHFANALIDMHRLELLPTIFPALQGVHLNEIKQRVAAIEASKEALETIWCLLELFPEITEQEARDLAVYIRASNHERDLAVYYVNLRKALLQDVDLPTWTAIYAHPQFEEALTLIAGHLEEKEHQDLLSTHLKHIDHLQLHINRHREKKPLMTASMLQENGILPGKTMGVLLKEAERLAIIHNLDHPDALLELLKKTPIWN